MGRGLRELQHVRCIDLSVPISPRTQELFPPHIEYIDHRHAAQELAEVAAHLIRQADPQSEHAAAITEHSFRDGLGLANENLKIDTHAGTHMDAPWHFGPLCENKPSKTIDQIPLNWCFGPGVVLDLRHKRAGDTITIADLQETLQRIPHQLHPGEIVLLMTGADKHFGQADYFSAHPGMSREATLWLVEQGIRMMGTDGWGFDRPAGAMIRDYLQTRDSASLLPAHMAGRDREYCHIEKLANLDQIPTPSGFWVSCFPIKVEQASAGWIRAVALVEDIPS
jgi:kynurenine formamidase